VTFLNVQLSQLFFINLLKKKRLQKEKSAPGQQHVVTSRTAIFSRHDKRQSSSADFPVAVTRMSPSAPVERRQSENMVTEITRSQ